MNKRVLLFVLLGFLLTTAGLHYTKQTTKDKVETSPMYFIDPLLLPYVLDYEKELKDRGVSVPNNQSFSVLLSRMPVRIAGIAIGMRNDYAVNVAINIALWKSYTETEKRFLIYHELSHDIFNVEHNSCRLMVTSMVDVGDEDFNAIMNELANLIKCIQE